MEDKERKDMKVPKEIMVAKKEVDHKCVSLLCSTQVGSLLVCLWYVL